MNWFKRIIDWFRGTPAIAGYDPIKRGWPSLALRPLRPTSPPRLEDRL